MGKNYPQLEDGYTKIANYWLDIFACTPLSGSEWRVLHAILRKTYGYGKKWDYISYGQFEKITQIKARHLTRIIKKLSDKKMILVDKSEYITKYTLNKVSPKWGIPQMGEESIPQMGEYKRKKERKKYTPKGDKEKKRMYKEPTIELDELGEEIQIDPIKKIPRGLIPAISRYYLKTFGCPEVKGIFYGHKPIIEDMIAEARKECGDDFKAIESSIKEKIDMAKRKCDKEGWEKMRLSTILLNWNNTEEEIKLDVSMRREL